jgi:lipopolysaccharide transport system ATP-binding protein
VPHREYVLQYHVRFTAESFAVRFGTLVKTILGADITGMADPPFRQPALPYVPPGAEFDVAFRFRCELMPGVYFANTGLVGLVDGAERYLHRLEDVLMFRVLEGYNRSTAGVSDLFVDSQVEPCPAETAAAA